MAKRKGFIEEFKLFIARGSVIDLAVGIIIGSAFTKIVNSLVNDVIMPVVGMILGGVNFTDLKIVIRKESGDLAALAITYGNFIQAVIDFLLIALVVFILIRSINTFREKSEQLLKRKEQEKEEVISEPTVPPITDIDLLTEIRDLLKKDK